MPPALSDDEASDFDLPTRNGPPTPGSIEDEADSDSEAEIESKKAPATRVKNEKSKSAEPAKSEPEDDEDEDDEDDEDVFAVEAIKGHMVDKKGNVRFQVKWEGYEDKKDMTWEPEDGLAESASEVLQEYLTSIGGREAIFTETDKAVRGKKRGRPGATTPAPAGAKKTRKNGTHPASSTPPATKKWTPPLGSWEDDIETIDACEDEGSTGKLKVLLSWKNGQKTRHDTPVIYKKCPQKMLLFYERHVKIISQENKDLAASTQATSGV